MRRRSSKVFIKIGDITLLLQKLTRRLASLKFFPFFPTIKAGGEIITFFHRVIDIANIILVAVRTITVSVHRTIDSFTLMLTIRFLNYLTHHTASPPLLYTPNDNRSKFFSYHYNILIYVCFYISFVLQ